MNVDMAPGRFPLSISQQNIAAAVSASGENPVANVCADISISGHYDPDALRRAIDDVVEADDTLRLRIDTRTGTQYVEPFRRVRRPYYDFTHSDADGAENWKLAVGQTAFPLDGVPLADFLLYRTGMYEGGVLALLHHAITDGRSVELLAKRIADAYLAECAHKKPVFDLGKPYAEHVAEETAYMSSPAFEADEKYWKNAAREFVSRGARSVFRVEADGADLSIVGRRVSYTLPASLCRALTAACADGASPFTLFASALALCLGKNGGGAVSLGVPVLGRRDAAEANASGMYVSTLPFFIPPADGLTPAEYIDEVNDRWYSLLRRQRYPYSRIASLVREAAAEAGLPEDSYRRLYDVVLSYRETAVFTGDACGARIRFSGKWLYPGAQTEPLVIHLVGNGEGGYTVDYDCNVQLVTKEDARSLHEHIINALISLLPDSDAKQRVSIVGRGERERVLYDFNKTRHTAPPFEGGTVADAFFAAAEAYPDRAALIDNGRRITYRALAARVRALAAAIKCAVSGAFRDSEDELIVTVALPREADLVAGMLAASEAGGAWLNVPPDLPKARAEAVIARGGARVILTHPRCAPSNPNALPVVYTTDVADASDERAARAENPRSLAYIVCTSGTTGEPKAVEIGSAAILNFARGMRGRFGHGGVLSLCPTGFDAFLIESVCALLDGRTVILAPPGGENDPETLASLIRSYGVGFMALTPSRLRVYLENPRFAEAAKRLDTVVLGGEALSPDTVTTIRAFTEARLYNQYGPSETAVGVSMADLGDVAANELTAGAPMPGCRLYVLDGELEPTPLGMPGELWIGGVCVGLGYRGDPSATESAFRPNPFEPGERMYRSGDAARFTRDGEIVICGRLDSQIKLRGQRIELGEIARALGGIPGVAGAAVKLCGEGAGAFIAGYYTAAEELPEAALREHLAEMLPSYMIPSAFVRLAALPLSANGKVDTRALPEPVLAATAGRRAEGDAEKLMVRLFADALGMPEIAADADFFRCGGDSLRAMSLLAAIERETGVTLKISELYALRTPALIAQKIGGAHAARTASRRTHTPRTRYAATSIQRSIYLASSRCGSMCAYNMPGAIKLAAPPDARRLEDAFRAVIADDSVYRTSFTVGADGLTAVVADRVDFTLGRITAGSFDEACRSFVAPFDLSKAPLLRAALADIGGEAYLFIDAHHIIGDGISSAAFFRRLDAAYNGTFVRRSADAPDYGDYAALEASRGGPDADYWRSALAGMPAAAVPVPDRDAPFDFVGMRGETLLGEALSARADTAANALGVTPFAFFASAVAVLLARLTGSRDITVGTPVSTRGDDIDVAGAFIDTLPLRLRPDDALTVREYIKQSAERTAELLSHTNVSSETLSELAGGTPYSAMFALRPVPADKIELCGGSAELIPVPTGAVKLPLVVEAWRADDGWRFGIEYSTARYDAETVSLWQRSLCAVIDAFARDPDAMLSAVDAISPRDRFALYERPAFTRAVYADMPVDTLAFRMSELTPDEPAIIWRANGAKRTLTFAQFYKKSLAAAKLLRDKNISGETVAVCMKRTPEMICAVFGTMAASCAYMPLLPSLPEERIALMLESAGAAAIICDAESAALLPDRFAELIIKWDGSDEADGLYLSDAGRSTGDVAQIMFTSGSTGVPKGVMLTHRNLAQLCGTLGDMYERAGVRSVLCSSSVMFDSFTVEVIVPLALGHAVVMAGESECMSPSALAAIIEETDATLMFSTPSRTAVFLEDDAFARAMEHIRMFMSGGEVLSATLARALTDACPGDVYNMYGPVETTAFVTAELVRRGCDEPPGIGRANPGTRVYVLDENMRFVMPTAEGEIYIGGDCVAAGYVGCPDSPAFTSDPFVSGGRLYRTGDRARMRPDGSLVYLGRADSQVKLNGQRVETDEIKCCIIGSGYASDACVLLRHNGAGAALYAYVVATERYDEDELRAALREKLPAYMVPSTFVTVPSIPKTESGKTDSKALLAKYGGADASAENAAVRPDFNAVAGTKTENAGAGDAHAEKAAAVNIHAENDANIIADKIVRLWREVLSETEISRDRSFFEQGGTSLAAMSMIIKYAKNGWNMTLGEFCEAPTISAHAEIIGKRSISASDEKDAGCEKYPAASSPVIIKERKTVLLTGSTGFLGAHLARELAENDRRVVCLVRGDESRLADTMRFYFGGVPEGVEAVSGDVTQSGLGLSRVIDAAEVWHAAADVRHFAAAAESDAVNVCGTANAIAFAKERGARFVYISTASVAEGVKRAAPGEVLVFDENSRADDSYASGSYVKSKIKAESLVFDAAESGLDARILRVGRLVGRASDGAFQRNPQQNYFWLLIKRLSTLGCLPRGLDALPVELTPVDLCARACVAAADALRVAHIYNPAESTLGDILTLISGGYDTVESDEFTRRIVDSAVADSDSASAAVALDALGRTFTPPPARLVCDITMRTLEKTGFSWTSDISTVLAAFGSGPMTK